MKWSLTSPCGDCPFRKKGGIRLSRTRAKEIANGMLHPQGITFPCHKTVKRDDEGERTEGDHEKHCAGALIFAEKHGRATQMMRIMERIGVYDHTQLVGRDEVVDSYKEMVR